MGSRSKAVSESMAKDVADMTPMQKIQRWTELSQRLEGYGGHDAPLAKLLVPVSAESSPTPSNPHHSTTVFTMRIPREFCNASGSLHGGAVALIFDITTSSAIGALSRKGFWDTGHVSRTLNCTYLRPVPEGEEIRIESEVVHLGKRMGVVKGEIKDKNGKVCYTCEHGKAAVLRSSL